MLVFTHRDVLPHHRDASAFAPAFGPGASRIGIASVTREGGSRWVLADVDDEASESDALDLLLPLFRGPRPLLVYLHGHGSTPTHCFNRCAQLEAEYDVEVIGFSWASEGLLCDGSPLPKLEAPGVPAEEGEIATINPLNRNTPTGQQLARRYHQSKTNALDAVDALARFLRHMATARLISNAQRFSIAAHSLGAHFLQNALEVPGAAESLGAAHNIVLLAPCVRADGHKGWAHQLRPRGRTYVTFHKGDSVLFGAFIADGGKQEKLGAAPGTELLRGPGFRYVDFSNSQVGLGAHRYFVERLNEHSRKLFGRLFRSEPDVQVGEGEQDVYPFGSSQAGAVWHMAVPAADAARA
jgi:esterase/lipase superfamily enzyme